MTFKKGHTPYITTNRKVSEETRRKLSENNPRYWLGKKFTAEHRKKISLANKGKPSWIKGKHHSEASKKKTSLSQKGKPKPWLRGIIRSEETRRKISESKKGRHSQLKGRHISEDHKRKISLSNMGKLPTNKDIPHSKKTKEKISKSMKNYWETK